MTMTRETKELTTVDARRELTKLPEKLGANPATVVVTRRGIRGEHEQGHEQKEYPQHNYGRDCHLGLRDGRTVER